MKRKIREWCLKTFFPKEYEIIKRARIERLLKIAQQKIGITRYLPPREVEKLFNEVQATSFHKILQDEHRYQAPTIPKAIKED